MKEYYVKEDKGDIEMNYLKSVILGLLGGFVTIAISLFTAIITIVAGFLGIIEGFDI